MKYYIYLLLLIVCSSTELKAQQTYYVSNSGDDMNNGTSANTPLRSISKVNTLVLQPGSRVLFRRGDTFRGMLLISQSGTAINPIVIDSYGTGNKPIIAGSEVVSGWVNVGNGRWQATCNNCSSGITGLYANAVSLPLGRYPNPNEPNRGYLTVQSHVGKTTLVSQQPLPSNFIGGEVAVRSNYFIIDRALITQQNSNTITLSNSSAYDLSDGFGYFIQNHPNTLDRQGEWHYDTANKKITLYSSQSDPNNASITATVYSQGVTARGRSGISVNNLQIAETLNIGMYFENCSDITVRGCEIINSGENAVYFSGSGNAVLFDSNKVIKTNNNGFQIDTYNNFTFRNNVILRTALEPGRGKSGDAQYNAFSAYSRTNTLIEKNVIDSTGYSALNFPKDNTIVQQNVVSNFCMTKNDGGGLYITNNDQETMGNVQLLENIVFNGLGVPEGTPDGFLGANGIYLDNCIQNIIVKNNTTFNCSGAGIYLHDASNILTESNTSFDNTDTQYTIDYTTSCPSTNNVTRNNVFVAKLPTQYAAIYNSYTANLSTFGSFTSNSYARPLDDVQTLRLSYAPPNGNLFDPQSLNEWQTRYGKDLNSTKSPLTYKGYIFNSFTGPERVVGGDFTLNSGYGFGGPFIFSDFGNGQGTWDNNNRVNNGGSLNLNFTSVTNNPGASLYAAQVINAVSKDKDYIVRFDAISTVPNRLVQVYIQSQFAPFLPLVDTRPAVVVGTTAQSYEVAIRPIRDLDNALVVLRVFENAQPLFVDNFSFREASISRIDPDKLSFIIYNPTATDSIVTLNGNYRDVNNQLYSDQVTIPAYRSLVLFRETAETTGSADLSIKLDVDKEVVNTNEVTTFRVRVRNNGMSGITSAPVNARWEIRLPPNLQVTNSTGLQIVNGVISGTVTNLVSLSESVMTFQARPTVPGIYKMDVNIRSSTYIDPDSTPNSGTGNGEDDESQAVFRTRESSNAIFVSANPNQRSLPAVETNEPVADQTKADLNLRVKLSSNTLSINQLVSCTVVITNQGGAYANGIQIQNVLPAGLVFVSGTGWTQNGSLLSASLDRLPVGESFVFVFTARAVAVGQWTNQAQILVSGNPDPDSTPNNGYGRGEDDQAQASFRVY
ncbi:right-handed parallel beta-helix repeat-containing protein [Fibrella arboris]|uniref:right-handed parallel beta-helix repeat-containing protein n=1 Tax=Fibrella arboris TaxID=3242486 RepID=UPI00351FEB9B